MINATGTQIAFLVFAVHFFSMLLGEAIAGVIGSPGMTASFTALLITFGIAVGLLAGLQPLRRFAATELARPLPLPMAREIAIVAAAKVATPAAVVGFAAAVALSAGETASIRQGIWPVDPARAWTWITSPTGLFQLVILSWVVGPLVEEIVFRGLLYRAWERQWGWVPSLLLTSACFSLCHPTHMASSFLGSVIYICVLRRSGTLLAPIAVHALFNILVSWPLLGQLIMQAPKGDPQSWSTWAPFLACLAFTVVALPAYVLMSRRDARDTATC